MKELIKPTTSEEMIANIELFSDPDDCCSPHWWYSCYKWCNEGASNNSPIEEDDILF